MADHDPARLAETILGGGALTAFGALLGTVVQSLRKPSAPAEMIQAAGNVAREMMAELRSEVTRLDQKVIRLEAEHADCRTALAESQKDRDELRAKIDQLMDGRIAGYGDKPPLL